MIKNNNCKNSSPADQLPPPSNPKHIWLDDFTVNVSWSWMKPRNLSVNCKIKYELCLEHEVDQGDREKVGILGRVWVGSPGVPMQQHQSVSSISLLY